MRPATIGFGWMGANIVRLVRDGCGVVVFDRKSAAIDAMARRDAFGATSLDDVAATMAAPRIFQVILPAGEPTEDAVDAQKALASPGSVIEGDSIFYNDDIRRGRASAEKQVHCVDVCTFGDKLLAAMRVGFGGHVEMLQ